MVPTSDPEPQDGRIALRLDRDICVGAANCVSMMSSAFDLTDDGRAFLTVESVDAAEAETVAEVIDLCPAAAISAGRIRP